MESTEPLTKFDGFIGAAILDKAGAVLQREGEEFDVAQVFALMQDTGALLNSGALGAAALRKITVAFSGFEFGITISGDKIHVLKQQSQAS